MSDRVFAGATVSEALDTAARALGTTRAELRYVVIDPGAAPARGLGGTPARVAVLLHRPPPRVAVATQERSSGSATDEVEALIAELRRAAKIDVTHRVEEEDGLLSVALDGPDREFFFGPEDSGEVLRAFEYLLQGAYSQFVEGGRVVVTCQGFAERREAALRELAERLAREVREDRQPRETPPLNSFERRQVHLAIQDQPDLVTYSVGEGSERRVTVALKGGEGSPEAFGEPGD